MNAAYRNHLDERPTTAHDVTVRAPGPEILTVGRPPTPSGNAGAGRALRSLVSCHNPCLDCGLEPHAHPLRTVAMIVLVGVLAVGITGEADHVPNLTDCQQLRQLTRAENQALVVADTHQLDTLLATDFTAVTTDGITVSRQQLIAALGSADLDVWSVRIVEPSTADPIEVHVNGTDATVSYESDMEVGSHPLRYQHDSTGADYHQMLRTRHTDTWTRSDGTWKHLRAETAAASSTAQQPTCLDGTAQRTDPSLFGQGAG